MTSTANTARIVRLVLLPAALLVTAPGVYGQAGRGGSARDTVVADVRTALGHGDLATARRLADTTTAPAASKALAGALVDIFQGQDDAAAAALTPVAAQNPLGDASLELGLIDLRHGRRDQGRARLGAISDALYARASESQAMTDDDYLRLARAAYAVGKVLLADDAFKLVHGARADAQTAWGDMELARHRADLASQSYRAALTADPAWVAAHLGLARAFGDDDPQHAAAELDAAHKLAPDDPDLWLALAQQRVEDDDFPGTAEALDRAAKVRPHTMDEAVLRVALAFESKEASALPAALKALDAIDPRSARGFRAAAQQAAHDYRVEDAAALGKEAVARDPDDADAHADLGLYLLRIGDETNARAELERAFKMDNSNPITKNLLEMLDRLDKFTVVTDGDLVFKFPAEDAAVLKLYALPLGEEAMKTYTARYGFTPKGPILVEMFDRHDDFAVRTVGLQGITGALGACFGRVVTMDEPRARPQGDYSWRATEWHELAHVFTLQLSDYRVPRWLTEGMSVYEEYRRNPAWGRESTLEFAAALGQHKTFGVKGLPEAFKNPANFSLAYFEASLVVEHLENLAGDEGLRRLLRAYAAGANDADAFVQAFGKDLDTVEASYDAFIEQRYGALREAMRAPAKEVAPDDLEGLKARAAAAPGNFISQASFGAALFKSGDLAAATAPLERAAALAPDPGEGSPHALLAQVAEKNGDEAHARQQLRELLAYDHENIAAARELAGLAEKAKAYDDEDFALQLVTDLDPFDAAAHTKLGGRLMAKNDYARALVEFRAVLTLNPTNLAEAHADAAEALLKLNRLDEAKHEALEALKLAPTYARAQDLLLAAMGKI